MFIKAFSNKKGMTLVEMILAISISIVVVMVLLVSSINGLKYAAEIRRKQRAQAETDYLINKLAYWTRQGKQINASASQLEITLKDDSKKVFRKNAQNEIILDNVNQSGSVTNSETITNNIRITNPELFTLKDYSVKIYFLVNSDFEVKTILAQRNF